MLLMHEQWDPTSLTRRSHKGWEWHYFVGAIVGSRRKENDPILALNPDGEKKVGFIGN